MRPSAALSVVLARALPLRVAAQTGAGPQLRAGALTGDVRLDGVLDEAAWAAAPAIDALTMSEPTAGGTPSATTTVRVLADAHALVIGIVCLDREPSRIVSFTKQRDAVLDAEDNVAIVLDTFMDGRSGYVFKVNPSGARYDALINGGHDKPSGHSVEIAIALVYNVPQ